MAARLTGEHNPDVFNVLEMPEEHLEKIAEESDQSRDTQRGAAEWQKTITA